MFELIVGLALLPFAIVTVLLLIGVVVLTWRLIATAAVFLVIIFSLLTLQDGTEKIIMLVFMSIILVAIWLRSSIVEPAPSRNELNADSSTPLIIYMKRKKRFSVRDIKEEFGIKNVIEAHQAIDAIQATGLIEPEGFFSLHWRVVPKQRRP